MTTGHKHRIVKVKRGGLTYRVLRKRLWHTLNGPYVTRSMFVFGPCPEHKHCWALSLLGILHTFTGLTVDTYE
jgi:hypothetical protein